MSLSTFTELAHTLSLTLGTLGLGLASPLLATFAFLVGLGIGCEVRLGLSVCPEPTQ